MVDTFNFESNFREFNEVKMLDFKTSDGTEWKLSEEWLTAQTSEHTILQRIVFTKQNYYDRYYIVNMEITSLRSQNSGKLEMAKGSGPVFTSITVPLDNFRIFSYNNATQCIANGVSISQRVLTDNFRYKVTISRAYLLQGEGDYQYIPPREKLMVFSDQILSLLETGNFSDVILTNGHFQIRAHKNILCARSEYFRAMFNSGMVEVRNKTIYLRNMSEKVLREFLHFIYSGNLRHLEASTASELLKVADMMHLNELKNMCCKVLERSICLENVDKILHLAHSHRAEDLKVFSINFAVEIYEEVMRQVLYFSCEICLQLVEEARQAVRE